MTEPYNTTFMENGTGITNLVMGVNNNLNGMFVGGILLVAWIILFVAGRKNTDGLIAFTGSSFIILFATILLYAGGVVTYYFIGLPLIAFMGGMLAYFITNRN